MASEVARAARDKDSYVLFFQKTQNAPCETREGPVNPSLVLLHSSPAVW